MRPAAEIEPVALLVDVQVLAGRNGVDQFALEGLALLLEEVERLIARPDFLHDRPVARDDLAHLLFDDRQVFDRERRLAIEIVIKAVLDHRADGDLRARKKLLHRLGQHMRGVVTNKLQRARIVAAHELEFHVAVDGRGEIGERAVEGHGDRALGERWRDGFGDVEAGNAGLERTGRPVGEGDVDHALSLSAQSPMRAGVRRGGVREDADGE